MIPEAIDCPAVFDFNAPEGEGWEMLEVESTYPGKQVRKVTVRVGLSGPCGAPAGAKCRQLTHDGRDLIEGAHAARRAAAMDQPWEAPEVPSDIRGVPREGAVDSLLRRSRESDDRRRSGRIRREW